ncbi:helix-turn-helix domain-containing protein [Halomarina oriensis]|uniref:Bacterio-opsin activator n=1 Tax=Halomarina oriensis TaxID=671145 RepID=A0A6B0GM09_9EURY|nr:helix-turn-helix domain-containing protein [Halomarina oriensis]MWG34519.1 bacterio-opsin activator [Halomarina oriensis]
MFTTTIDIDLDADYVLSDLAAIDDGSFPIYYFETIDDENIRFVMDAGEHRDAIAEALAASDAVHDLEYVPETQLVITKRSSGVLPIIREHHGMLQQMNQFDGTRRTFDVIIFSRDDLRAIISDLRDLGTVRLSRIHPIGNPTSALSARQSEVVTLAYESGYFDWPRRSDAETLAAELGISHTTFLEHLRKGERKLIGEALSSALPTTELADQ